MNTRNSRLKHKMACNGVKYTVPENSSLITNVKEDVGYSELLFIKMCYVNIVNSHCEMKKNNLLKNTK